MAMSRRRFRKYLLDCYNEADSLEGYSLFPKWQIFTFEKGKGLVFVTKERRMENALRTKTILEAVRNEIIRMRRLEIMHKKLQGQLDPNTRNIAKQSGDMNDTLPQNENDYKLSKRRLKMMDGMMLRYLKGKTDIHQAAGGMAFALGCQGPVPLYFYDGLLTAAMMTGKITPQTMTEAQMELRGVPSQSELLIQAQKDPFGVYDATKVRLSGKNKWENLGRFNADTAEKKKEVKGQVLRFIRNTQIQTTDERPMEAGQAREVSADSHAAPRTSSFSDAHSLPRPRITANSHNAGYDSAKKTVFSRDLMAMSGRGSTTVNKNAHAAGKKLQVMADQLGSGGR